MPDKNRLDGGEFFCGFHGTKREEHSGERHAIRKRAAVGIGVRIFGLAGQGTDRSAGRRLLAGTLLKKGDRNKLICAVIAKGKTTVGNERLAERLATGHGSSVSTLVQRIRRDKKEQSTLRNYERIRKIWDWYHFRVVRSRRASPLGLEFARLTPFIEMRNLTPFTSAAFLLASAPCSHAATVVLPPITVTSMGTRTDFSKSGNPTAHHSGLSQGFYGAATASTFPSTIVATGDTIQMSFLPEDGKFFYLLPGYGTLELDVYFGSGGMFYGLPVSVTFLGLSGGSAPVFSAVQAATNSSAIIGGMFTQDQPSAPLTFTGLEISWVSPDAATVGPLSLNNVLFKTTSSPPDSTAFLSLQSVPEPTTALLYGLGLLAFFHRKRNTRLH